LSRIYLEKTKHVISIMYFALVSTAFRIAHSVLHSLLPACGEYTSKLLHPFKVQHLANVTCSNKTRDNAPTMKIGLFITSVSSMLQTDAWFKEIKGIN
jgi:hypothetical protein